MCKVTLGSQVENIWTHTQNYVWKETLNSKKSLIYLPHLFADVSSTVALILGLQADLYLKYLDAKSGCLMDHWKTDLCYNIMLQYFTFGEI